MYDFWLRGRIVLEVAVDNAQTSSEQTGYPIYVGRPGAVESQGDVDLLATNGRAVKRTFYVPGETENDAPDGLHVHVDPESVYSYVRPRLAVLLAKVFVPGEATPTQDTAPAE